MSYAVLTLLAATLTIPMPCVRWLLYAQSAASLCFTSVYVANVNTPSQTLGARPDKEQTGSGGEPILTKSSCWSLDRFVFIPLARAVEKRSRRRSEDDG
jgi:hypothetical protein